MKILLSLLRNFIDINLPADQIAKRLTMAGIEVDAIEDLSLGCKQVVVCTVLSTEKHPQADKLNLATVSDGQNTYQVVCGATNCRPGIKTALATVGATVFDDEGNPFKIKKNKIRGIESVGMLCAPIELGLPSGNEGIIEFSDSVKNGTDVSTMYADIVFDISITPNLGHCTSLLGVARELSASLNLPIHLPKSPIIEDQFLNIESEIKVTINNLNDCPRYACRIIRNLKITDSPEWLKKQLEASGIRSINTVVDVTNYVMLELGHPLHAFDYDLIEGHQINVRNAHHEEKFVTLDGIERLLESRDLLICDAAKPVALAGIMGGNNSEITHSTQNVLLEAACFSPIAIRKTSKRLGLNTDASKRFERGCDNNILNQVLDRASGMIQMIAGGTVCQGIFNTLPTDFPKKKINCRIDRVNKILGTHLVVGEIEEIFQRLSMISKYDGINTFTVEIPTYRNDINEEIDLVSEVARIYGYENIVTSNTHAHISTIPHAPIFIFEREIRTRLLREGLQEFLTCDLIGPSLLNIVKEDTFSKNSQIHVLNPNSIEQSILRTSLLPGLLQVVKYNYDHQNHDIAGFEIGRIHFHENDHYREQSVAAIVLSGKSRSPHWDIKPTEYDFYDIKGMIESLLTELKVRNIQYFPSRLCSLHPGRQLAIHCDNKIIGRIGEVHPALLRRLDMNQRIFFAEINLHDLYPSISLDHKMERIPLYPGSERDLTLSLEESMPIKEIFDTIQICSSRLLENITLIDIYRSEKLKQNTKNATFRFLYRDKEKTIDQEQVDKEHARITTKISQHLTKGD